MSSPSPSVCASSDPGNGGNIPFSVIHYPLSVIKNVHIMGTIVRIERDFPTSFSLVIPTRRCLAFPTLRVDYHGPGHGRYGSSWGEWRVFLWGIPLAGRGV